MEKPRVLIADDNEAICTLLRALLQRDYEVEVARGGAEAIALLHTRSYSAVLLDLLMPEVDGFAVLEDLRDQRPDLLCQVIVLTAAVTARDVARAQTFAVYDIIRKPFEVAALLVAIRKCAGLPDGASGSKALLSASMLLLIAQMFSTR